MLCVSVCNMDPKFYDRVGALLDDEDVDGNDSESTADDSDAEPDYVLPDNDNHESSSEEEYSDDELLELQGDQNEVTVAN